MSSLDAQLTSLQVADLLRNKRIKSYCWLRHFACICIKFIDVQHVSAADAHVKLSTLLKCRYVFPNRTRIHSVFYGTFPSSATEWIQLYVRMSGGNNEVIILVALLPPFPFSINFEYQKWKPDNCVSRLNIQIFLYMNIKLHAPKFFYYQIISGLW